MFDRIERTDTVLNRQPNNLCGAIKGQVCNDSTMCNGITQFQHAICGPGSRHQHDPVWAKPYVPISITRVHTVGQKHRITVDSRINPRLNRRLVGGDANGGGYRRNGEA